MEPHGFTVFCDDIRDEVSSKVSLIGCYTNELIYHGQEPPFVLPKLGFYITCRFPIGTKLSNAKLLVFFPGDEDTPTFNQSIPENEEFVGNSQEHAVLNFHLRVLIAPVLIKEPGKIKVRLSYEPDKLVKLGILRLRPAPNAVATPIPGAPNALLPPA